MDAMSHETNETIADGEVVWSWRPEVLPRMRYALSRT